MSNTKQKPGAMKKKNEDLPDSPRDRKELQGDDTTINLPDVSDIPGQEHVRPPVLKEFGDTTISSKDEEGGDLWEDNGKSDDSNVSRLERKLLDESENDMPGTDDQQLRRAQLDSVDNDGVPLNERSAADGNDLDVPGSGEDDAEEEIGEEDEENNSYSLGGDDQSANEERNDD